MPRAGLRNQFLRRSGTQKRVNRRQKPQSFGVILRFKTFHKRILTYFVT
jgi:hypothetical protein